MQVRIRKAYIEAGNGPHLTNEKAEFLEQTVPTDHLEHLFTLEQAFYGADHAHGDYASTPVKIISCETNKAFIVRFGDVYETDEKQSGWVTDEAYKKKGVHVCPNINCRSENTEGMGVDIDGTTAKQYMFCRECESSWTALFSLTGYAIE